MEIVRMVRMVTCVGTKRQTARKGGKEEAEEE